VARPGPRTTRTAYEGPYLRVEVERWPDHGDYEIVRKHDAAAVVAVRPDDHVLLVRQFRPPVRDALLEIPAGLLDVDGEDAATCAARELREETGYAATTVEFLGGCYLSPGFTDEYIHLFWARTEPEPRGAVEEGIELIAMPFERAVAAAREGRVRNASSALGLLLAAARRPVP
jgi:ADP-ribose pyrophosphatase